LKREDKREKGREGKIVYVYAVSTLERVIEGEFSKYIEK
jgi:hypothetical protein